MVVYGVTVIRSDAFDPQTDEGISYYGKESSTKLFTDPGARIDYIFEVLPREFDRFEFEDGSDERGNTLETLKKDLLNEEDVCIQGPYAHTQIEFFTQDVEGVWKGGNLCEVQ